MKTEEFDYRLPKGLIAQTPLLKREEANLLLLFRKEKRWEKKKFYQITEYLNEGDLIVLNETKVIPARLFAKKPTGGRIELLLLKRLSRTLWEALSRGRIREGTKLYFGSDLEGKIEKKKEGKALVRFDFKGDFKDLLSKYGKVPLPPYIKREAEDFDKEYYQAVYAKKDGAIAAPTAGLHWTESLLKEVKDKGIKTSFLTLHTGWGTFKPIKTKNVEEHKMEEEYFEIPEGTANIINKTKSSGRRVIACGTTVVRALESSTNCSGSPCGSRDRSPKVIPQNGFTHLFIYPGYKFNVVDGLLTNFHFPMTTLFLLVSAFAGVDFIQKAYQYAIKERFRFYSYGDAMLIL